MNLNLTLLGQMITFALFVWFTMKFVWPMITETMHERQNKIADGLAAAEQGLKDLEMAEHRSLEILTEAKAKAASILENANQRANHIIEESKAKARIEGDRLIELAESEIQQQYVSAKESLFNQVSDIALSASEKILKREVDADSNNQIINELVGDLQ